MRSPPQKPALNLQREGRALRRGSEAIIPRSTQRPREKILGGASARLSLSELLALLIGTGHQRYGDAEQIARELLEQIGGLTSLQQVTVAQLQSMRGLGPVKASRILACLELARRLNAGHSPIERRPEAPVLRWVRALRSEWSGERPMCLLFTPPGVEGMVTLSLEGALDLPLQQLMRSMILQAPRGRQVFAALRVGPAPETSEREQLQALFQAAQLFGVELDSALIISGERHWELSAAELGG